MSNLLERNLDTCYFRVERNGELCNICFTDMYEEEQKAVLEILSQEEIKKLLLEIAKVARSLGDLFNLKLDNTSFYEYEESEFSQDEIQVRGLNDESSDKT